MLAAELPGGLFRGVLFRGVVELGVPQQPWPGRLAAPARSRSMSDRRAGSA